MHQHTFSTIEIANILNISVRRIDYWVKKGIIIPSIKKAKGSGKKHVYSTDDFIQLRFICRLLKHGWPLQKIRRCIEQLRIVIEDDNPLKTAILIHDPKTILAICKTKEGERILIDSLDTTNQQVMWIVLEVLNEELHNPNINVEVSCKETSETIS